MTTVSDIIRDAYRESNINAINVSPTASQQEEALRLLNRIVSSAYGNEAGEELQPLDLGANNISRPQGYPWVSPEEIANWFIPENTRLMLNLEADTMLYLPPLPEDGARLSVVDKSGNLATNTLTLVGNGRTIESATSLTLSTNSYSADWFYRGDTGNWTKVSPLIQTDTFPFPTDFDDYFVIALALRLNPRNGAALDPQSQAMYTTGKSRFRARYRQTQFVMSELALIYPYRTNRLIGYGGDSAGSRFNSGYPYIPG